MTHVFLSPHLDDVVFSCGGTIHRLSYQQEHVTVVNVMAGDPPAPLPDTPLVRELHTRWAAGENPMPHRRSEDRDALDCLGAEAIYLNLPDCVYRTAPDGTGLYPDGDDDIFGSIHPQDPTQQRLTDLPVPGTKRLYAPLAIGNHVDHCLVRDWALRLTEQRPDIKLLFYADYPYDENPMNAHQTLDAFDFSDALQMVTYTISIDDYEAKVRAFQRYESQLSTFWPDANTMKDRLYQYMTRIGEGILAERYWQYSPAGDSYGK